MNLKTINRFAVIAAVIAAAARPAGAIGIAVRFVDITLENVSPGDSINLRVFKNLPMIVQNLDHEAGVDIAITAVLASGKEMKEGYVPIPDPNWVKILPDHFHLGPGASSAADVVVTIPNDPKLIGHHYECIIWTHTEQRQNGMRSGVTFQTGLRNRLRMSIGTLGPASLQREKALKKLAEINVNFTISPDNLFVNEVPLGKALELKRDKRVALKVINQGDNPIELKMSVIPADPNIYPQAGYDYAPDPTWLRIDPPLIKVPENSIREARLLLHIPAGAEFHGRKYMFLVKTTLSDDTLPLAYYNMVYVATEP
jgi:hypothetical protein